MKRLGLLLCGTLLLATTVTGCFGRFGLTRTVYELNRGVGDRFLQTGVLWLFLFVPVYNVAALLDFFIFNTVEFWSGKNPIAAGEKTFSFAEGGRSGQVRAHREGDEMVYEVTEFRDGVRGDAYVVRWNVATGHAVVLPPGTGVTLPSAGTGMMSAVAQAHMPLL